MPESFHHQFVMLFVIRLLPISNWILSVVISYPSLKIPQTDRHSLLCLLLVGLGISGARTPKGGGAYISWAPRKGVRRTPAGDVYGPPGRRAQRLGIA